MCCQLWAQNSVWHTLGTQYVFVNEQGMHESQAFYPKREGHGGERESQAPASLELQLGNTDTQQVAGES